MTQQTIINGKVVSPDDISEMLRHLADVKQFTMWRNPTPNDVPLELHHETPKHGPSIADRVAHLDPSERDIKRRGSKAWEEFTGKRFFVIKAQGGTCLIPAEYDRAIQDVREGVIIGGLGSTLERMGTENRPVLHPALDAVDAARKKALAEAKAAKDEILLKEDDLLIARRRIAELEKLLGADATSAATAAPPQGSAPKKDK